jgi:hypothetical protein
MIGVECRFLSEGSVEVQRIQIDGRWLTIEQGRQWVDLGGRHVLIRAPGMAAQELNLRPDTMTWQIRPVGPPVQQIV